MTDYVIDDTPDFVIRAESKVFGLVLHSDLKVPWTKTVRKSFRGHISSIVRHCGVPVYAFQSPTCDPKKRKFIQIIGGTFNHILTDDDGVDCEMFLFHDLD